MVTHTADRIGCSVRANNPRAAAREAARLLRRPSGVFTVRLFWAGPDDVTHTVTVANGKEKQS